MLNSEAEAGNICKQQQQHGLQEREGTRGATGAGGERAGEPTDSYKIELVNSFIRRRADFACCARNAARTRNWRRSAARPGTDNTQVPVSAGCSLGSAYLEQGTGCRVQGAGYRVPGSSQQSSQVTLTKSDRGNGFSRFSLCCCGCWNSASAAVLLYYSARRRWRRSWSFTRSPSWSWCWSSSWARWTQAQAARCAGAPSDTWKRNENDSGKWQRRHQRAEFAGRAMTLA